MSQAPDGSYYVESQGYRHWVSKNYDVAHKKTPARKLIRKGAGEVVSQSGYYVEGGLKVVVAGVIPGLVSHAVIL
jgi:hypothetical protein